MKDFPITAFSWYCVFGFFLFYQQKHLLIFRGSSQVFYLFLNASVALGMLTGIIFIGYYAWSHSAMIALAIFLLSMPTAVFYNILEKFISPIGISLLGFVGWPISAYLMFSEIAG